MWLGRTERERFEEKYVLSKSKCWLWSAGLDRKGYGVFKPTGSRLHKRAHRISYEMHIGEIPAGLFILHKCDVRRCVNPKHLYAGTQKQNIQDALRRNRLCPAKGEKAGRSVLTKEQVIFIRANSIPYDPKLGRAALAKKYGVAASTISEVVLKNNWKHI